MSSSIIRNAIVNAIYKVMPVECISFPDPAVSAYATKRWGSKALVTKSTVNPIGAGTTNSPGDTPGPLVPETLVRDEFVQAVFSASIIGKLQGVMEVPAMTRVNVESSPVIAPFVGEFAEAPAFQGTYGVSMTDKRKVSIVTVVTDELLRMTSNAAETTISGSLQRALSRGLDTGFMGSQSRDAVSPAGLSAVSVSAASFSAGILAFTGDLSKASVIVNPLTAITLRSPTEQDITAAGGFYGGLPVITSYAVPVGKLFIVDGSRVLAYIGGATVELSRATSVVLDDGSGADTSTKAVSMFQEGKVALMGTQYCDWDFVPGAAVEVTLAA